MGFSLGVGEKVGKGEESGGRGRDEEVRRLREREREGLLNFMSATGYLFSVQV